MDRTPQHRSHDGDVDIEGIARTAEDRHVPVLRDMTVDLRTPARQHPGAGRRCDGSAALARSR